MRPADPGFIGYCKVNGADCGNKVLWKTDPGEKVGIIAEKKGKPCVVEYSELSEHMASKREVDGDETSRLSFGAANICNHYYSLAFLQKKVIPNLGNMFHVARKKIGAWDADVEETVTPEQNNGMKLESFIFDVFPLSKSMAIYQAERAYEFAPVKNAPGSDSDSPDTARALLSNVSKNWMEKAGAVVKGDLESDMCEISPLVSYFGEGLEGYVGDEGKLDGDEIRCPFVLDGEGGVEQAPEPLALSITRTLTGLASATFDNTNRNTSADGDQPEPELVLTDDVASGDAEGNDITTIEDEDGKASSESYSIIDRLCALPGSLVSSLRSSA